MPSESEIFAHLRRRAHASDQVRLGIGDDAAVIRITGEKDLIACCDLMVEGVHFRTEWMPARLLGRKALAVNLSDVAAMGGVPKFAMISVALPGKYSSKFIDELFEGAFELAEGCGVSIIGGDTSSSRDSLFIDVSVIGECETGKAVSRGGAKPGDAIYVTGSLGASALGLSLLEEGRRLDDVTDQPESVRVAILKHLSPEPRLKLGRAIAEAGLATAMIDISDGLSNDLRHIVDESDCGAVLHADVIPIAECVRSFESGAKSLEPLRLALHGGEEYELLFTAQPENKELVSKLSTSSGVAITAVGEIVDGGELQLQCAGLLEPLNPAGYEHII
jgi:thiamine-monophosphate kinase